MTEEPKRISQTLLTIVVFIFFIAIMFPFYRPVIMGILLGVVLYPLHSLLFGKKKVPRPLSSLIITLLVSIFFIAPIILISLLLIEDIADLSRTLRDFFSSPDQVREFLQRLNGLLPRWITTERIIQESTNFVQTASGFILGQAAELVGSLPKLILDIILLILTIYFTLADGHTLATRSVRYLPFDKRTSDRILDVAHKIVRGGFIGAVLSAGAQAAILALAYIILDIPRAGLIGALTFVTSFIPILGAIPGGAIGLAYLIIHGHYGGAVVMAVAFLLAGTIDNLIKPWVLKGSADLHPLLGLLSALGGLAIMGFVGIFIGPMIAAVCLESLAILEEESAGNFA